MQGLQAMAWLSAEELTHHPNGDSFLVSGQQMWCLQRCACWYIRLLKERLFSLLYADSSLTCLVLLQAVAGTAGEIAIISLVEARVVSLLKGNHAYSSMCA